MILLFITAPPYRTRGRLLCSFQARLDDVVSMNGDSKVNRLEQSSSQHAGKMCKRNVDIDRKKLFKKTQVSPIKSSSYEPYPVVSKQKAAPCVRRQMKEWLELTDVFANDFRVVMRSRDYESAMALYKRMADADYIPNENLLNGLLAICQKKSHMINALELFNDFTMMGITPNETAYMALIRCHTDNGEFNTALKLIDEMKLLSLQLKLRTYHPILEAACKELDFQSGILIINQMLLDDVIPHSEQVVILLEAAALSGALKDERNRQKIDTLLLDDKLHLLDMDLLGLQRILSASRGMTMTEIRDEGVLQGVFIPDTMPYQCQTLQEAIDFIGSDHVLNPVIGISCDTESIHSNETKKRRMYDILPSRMVNIVKGTCSCPNCGGDLNPLLLDPVGRERVRLGLISIALGASSYQALCIQVKYSFISFYLSVHLISILQI